MSQPTFVIPEEGRGSNRQIRSEKSVIRRPVVRQSRIANGISALVFFAAVTVVGAWGLSGFQAREERPAKAEPYLIYAGGAPTQPALENASGGKADDARDEDEYVVGQYGDPVSDLYADDDDDDGDWGQHALARAEEVLAPSEASGRGRRRE
jgi:hypothetical protein